MGLEPYLDRSTQQLTMLSGVDFVFWVCLIQNVSNPISIGFVYVELSSIMESNRTKTARQHYPNLLEQHSQLLQQIVSGNFYEIPIQ